MIAFTAKILTFVRGGFVKVCIVASGGKCGRRLRIERGLRVRHGFHRGYNLGDDIYIGCCTTIDCPKGGEISIGSNVTLTQGNFVSVAQSVSIGQNTLIGEYTSLRDANHGTHREWPIALQPMVPLGLSIGEDVWIGRGVAVLPGANIGDGAVIGANAVVTKPIAALGIAVGVPAKITRFR